MPRADRVNQAEIRQLYRAFCGGIYDDDLLREIGWGLHARCAEILSVTRAVRGEVPCPQCDRTVIRPKHAPRLAARRTARPRLPCPACGVALAWQDCQQALRDQPRCWSCWSVLHIDYAENLLRCPRCERTWPWRRYRASVAARRRLPCPRCGSSVQRRPQAEGRGDASSTARAASGKRQAERLHCAGCGHEFTWAAWRKGHGVISSRTGNLPPVERYWERWPRCAGREEQFIEIDTLLHAMHIRGSMAHLFIEGDEASLRALLDELGQQR